MADRPKIYEYLETKFEGVYNRMGQIESRLAILESREKPARPCQDFMHECIRTVEDKCETMAKDINGIAECHEKQLVAIQVKMENKVSYGKLYTILGSIGGLITGVWYFLKELTK